MQRVDCLKVTADNYRPVENALLVGAYLSYAHNASIFVDSGKLLRKHTLLLNLSGNCVCQFCFCSIL